MKITKEIWGRTPEGNDIHRYTLENSKGCFVRLCDVGAAIVSIGVPDRDGKVADVVLGYPDAYYGGTHVAQAHETTLAVLQRVPVNFLSFRGPAPYFLRDFHKACII